MLATDELLRRQELRLQVLKCIYNEVSGNMNKSVRQVSDIEELCSNINKDELLGILLYLYEKEYIQYIKASDMNGFDCLDIHITSKGIELIENIALGGNVSKFEEDFSKSILNISISGDVNNSNISVGNGNTQELSLTTKDSDSIFQLLDKLIEQNPTEGELVDVKEALNEERNKGSLSKFFLKGVGATIKQFATDVSIGVLTSVAKQSLGL